MTKRKYTFEQRLEVVMHYFATDDGYRITSARFNVPRTQVRMWVAAYDAYGEEGLRPRDKGVSIDPEIRIEAVNAVLSGQISRCQAATKYKLAGSASISRWGNGPNLLIVFYVQIMPDDFIMQLHRF
ncbi:TPA: transposase [Klebsiella pneumoniae]|nr:transposase [Klebsiella pneumoniae]HBV1673587.1 transposase [Klebsiella pneumoniae]